MGFKWLCLHGAGCNKEMFKSQLASLTFQLRKQYGDEFVWIDGKIEGKESDTLDYNGATDGPFLHWWELGGVQEQKDDLVKAKEDLRAAVEIAHNQIQEACKKHGPFDGIIGYSQGGTLIGDILIKEALHPNLPTMQEQPLKAVVLFGAPPPPDVWTDGGSIEGMVNAERVGSILKTPAIFVLGENDTWYNDVLIFKEIWAPEAARLVQHPGLHTMPGDTGVYEKVADTVREMRVAS